MTPTTADLAALETLRTTNQRGERFEQLEALGLAVCAHGTGLYFVTKEGERAMARATEEAPADGWHEAHELDAAPDGANFGYVSDGAVAQWVTADLNDLYDLESGEQLSGEEYREIAEAFAE